MLVICTDWDSFQYKDSVYRYRDSYYEDNIVVRLSYHYNCDSFTGVTISCYNVTSSLIGYIHTQNDPSILWYVFSPITRFRYLWKCSSHSGLLIAVKWLRLIAISNAKIKVSLLWLIFIKIGHMYLIFYWSVQFLCLKYEYEWTMISCLGLK